MGANSLAITASKCRSCPIQDFCPDKQSESEKYMKTPLSVIGIPEYKIPDYLDVINLSDFPISDVYRLIDTNSKIGGILFVDDILESDKVMEIMTADEYNEMHEKTKKFEELSDYLQALNNRKSFCEHGIDMIITSHGISGNEICLNYSCYGDGFQELVTQKVLEAFDEQIKRIEKQMEEL